MASEADARKSACALALAGLLASLTGCAGARTTVTADTAKVPISLSRAVRDADGDIVPQDRMKKVGTLSKSMTATGFFYSAARATPRRDISAVVNEQVKAHGGDAVVNLRVSSKPCGLDFVPLLTLLPIMPGCADLKVEGDIVKVLPSKASEPVASREVAR